MLQIRLTRDSAGFQIYGVEISWVHKQLCDARPKTGEGIAINVVQTPDCSCGENLRPFLPHLDEIWQWHFGSALGGQLDELETRLHLGILNGTIGLPKFVQFPRS